MDIKAKRLARRKMRVSSKIFGTAARPRLSVFRSNAHIYGQLVDDDKKVTLAASGDLKMAKKGLKKVDVAMAVGEDLAKKALKKKIKKVVFDRSGFGYHGRVKALAEGARKGGLVF